MTSLSLSEMNSLFTAQSTGRELIKICFHFKTVAENKSTDENTLKRLYIDTKRLFIVKSLSKANIR